MTAGYKTAAEIELEREKKKVEHANRPIPMEWKVERYEQYLNKKQEDYLKYLEKSRDEARKAKHMVTSLPPPLPPSSSAASVTGLPDLASNPWEALAKR